MCEESVVLYPPYICAYVGSIIVLFSLIHFLVCITANYAHIKKDRLLAPHGGETGSSLHGEKMAAAVAHYGTKPGHFETLKIHFPTSEGVSKVSERAKE